MNYYMYVEYDEYGDKTITISEEQILKEYYDYWYRKMCQKYGKTLVDKEYNKTHCIEDWCTTHWAWKIDKEIK